jgi:hypothetical protein
MSVAAPLLAVGSGAIAAVLAFFLGIPGQGIFIWTTLGFGAVCGAIIGTWSGALLTVFGAAAAAILIIVIGQTGGLVALVVAVLGGLLAVGYPCGLDRAPGGSAARCCISRTGGDRRHRCTRRGQCRVLVDGRGVRAESSMSRWASVALPDSSRKVTLSSRLELKGGSR